MLLVMSMDDTDARSSSALGSRLVANIPGIARRATPQSRIARGTKTPEVAAKENALRDLLIGVDGSLRGGTIRKVLVHVAFILENVDLIDCFLHGFR